MNCYREVKQAMANEGFDKTYLQEQIIEAISSAVKSCFSENIEKYTEAAIRAKCNDYRNDRLIADEIQKAVGKVLLGRVQVRLLGEKED